MERYLFAFPGVTIAMKASKILRENGYACEVIRTPKTLAGGCGYSTAVRGDPAEISELLVKYGITPKAVGSGK
jgi:hypothetical protein